MRELRDAPQHDRHERRGGALLDDACVRDEDLLEDPAVHQPLVAALARWLGIGLGLGLALGLGLGQV